MKGDVANQSTALVAISYTFVIATVVVFAVYLFFMRDKVWLLAVGGGLLAIVAWCYLRAPVGYEVRDNMLVVNLRVGTKVHGPIRTYRPAREPVSFVVRLWGNGGLFAVTGLYHNEAYGRFRAYVTNFDSLVLVEMRDGKIVVISPANPSQWLSTPENAVDDYSVTHG